MPPVVDMGLALTPETFEEAEALRDLAHLAQFNAGRDRALESAGGLVDAFDSPLVQGIVIQSFREFEKRAEAAAV